MNKESTMFMFITMYISLFICIYKGTKQHNCKKYKYKCKYKNKVNVNKQH